MSLPLTIADALASQTSDSWLDVDRSTNRFRVAQLRHPVDFNADVADRSRRRAS